MQTYYKHLFSAEPSVEERYAGTLRRDEGRRVRLCTKCGWPFSNPYLSPKHRRSHKKHCGTIEGYTVLIGVEAVSDDDYHGDTDKEKSPIASFKGQIKKKTSIGGSDGLRASISGSEDEFFSDDAVTEFSESGTSQRGSVKESLDKDLFYTFSDSKNGEAKKSTLGETQSPSAKKTDHAAKKDEAVNYKEGVEDGKKGRKKVKRVRPWVPFVCCSAKSPSVKKTDHAAKKEVVNDKEGIEDGKKGRKKVKRVRSWVPFVSSSAKSPSAKKTLEAKKDEAVNDKEGDPISPPKLIEDGKKGQKKLKGVSSWVLFCSSLDVVDSKKRKKSTLGEAESPSAKKTDHAAKKDEAVNYKEGIEDGKKGQKKVKRELKKDHEAKKDEAVNNKEGDPMSPLKLIEDGKKGRKKLKGVSSRVLFCSLLDVVDSKVMRIQ
ncbi:zinc finger, C2H2 [Tanacetum coccineum]